MTTSEVEHHLGEEAANLLNHKCMVPKDHLHLPGPDFVGRVLAVSGQSVSDKDTRFL